MPKESKIVTDIKNYLKSKQCYAVKYFGGSFSEPGVPDILACFKGRFMGLEVKVKSKVSKVQQFDLANIVKHGGFARIIYAENWKEQVDEVLNEIRDLQ